jgi:hypothetical protein
LFILNSFVFSILSDSQTILAKSIDFITSKPLSVEYFLHFSNIQDILSDPPTTWDRHRQAAYVAFAQAVVTGLRALDSPLLAYFDALVAEFLPVSAESPGVQAGDG